MSFFLKNFLKILLRVCSNSAEGTHPSLLEEIRHFLFLRFCADFLFLFSSDIPKQARNGE